jgi:hypothetical protein
MNFKNGEQEIEGRRRNACRRKETPLPLIETRIVLRIDEVFVQLLFIYLRPRRLPGGVWAGFFPIGVVDRIVILELFAGMVCFPLEFPSAHLLPSARDVVFSWSSPKIWSEISMSDKGEVSVIGEVEVLEKSK